MKKILISLILSIFLIFPAFAKNVKIGIILGFTGPIESLAPVMAKSAELAIEEVNNSGNFMHGKIEGVRADSTCVDAAAAQAEQERHRYARSGSVELACCTAVASTRKKWQRRRSARPSHQRAAVHGGQGDSGSGAAFQCDVGDGAGRFWGRVQVRGNRLHSHAV